MFKQLLEKVVVPDETGKPLDDLIEVIHTSKCNLMVTLFNYMKVHHHDSTEVSIVFDGRFPEFPSSMHYLSLDGDPAEILAHYLQKTLDGRKLISALFTTASTQKIEDIKCKKCESKVDLFYSQSSSCDFFRCINPENQCTCILPSDSSSQFRPSHLCSTCLSQNVYEYWRRLWVALYKRNLEYDLPLCIIQCTICSKQICPFDFIPKFDNQKQFESFQQQEQPSITKEDDAVPRVDFSNDDNQIALFQQQLSITEEEEVDDDDGGIFINHSTLQYPIETTEQPTEIDAVSPIFLCNDDDDDDDDTVSRVDFPNDENQITLFRHQQQQVSSNETQFEAQYQQSMINFTNSQIQTSSMEQTLNKLVDLVETFVGHKSQKKIGKRTCGICNEKGHYKRTCPEARRLVSPDSIEYHSVNDDIEN